MIITALKNYRGLKMWIFKALTHVFVAGIVVLCYFCNRSYAESNDFIRFNTGNLRGSGNFVDHFEENTGRVDFDSFGILGDGILTIKQSYKLSDGSLEKFRWNLTRIDAQTIQAKRSDLLEIFSMRIDGKFALLRYKAPMKSNSGISCPLFVSFVEEVFELLSEDTMRIKIRLSCGLKLVGESEINVKRFPSN